MTVALSSSNYPLLNLFWTMLWLFLWILWIFLLIRVITDVFRSDDLSGGAKALWTLFLIILPYIGVLAYLIVRGKGMEKRDRRDAVAADDAVRTYIRSAAGTQGSVAEELDKLAGLRERGVITETEFEAQKQRLLAHA